MVAVLLITGSAIIGILGLFHLIYTFRTNKFAPRDDELARRLRQVSPVLTPDTTMWKAWVGFNASHSLGVMFFATIYGYLAMFELEFLLSTSFLVALNLITLFSYLVLARAFWFNVPFIGISVSTAFFSTGYFIAYV